jgi:hypothetical protein
LTLLNRSLDSEESIVGILSSKLSFLSACMI